MPMNFQKSIILLLFVLASVSQEQSIPSDFIDVSQIIPDLNLELRYYSSHNFVGDTIEGYHGNTLYLTHAAAKQLKAVQEELQLQNLCLKVYDGYRPQRAVNHFVRWARNINDTINKQEFYPNVNKRNLFNEGYIASKSGHSRGSTVDLTLIDGSTGIALDMGSPYDFFGKSSWVNYDGISEAQSNNRKLLQRVMQKHGFRNYPKEWWHFTLRGEPYPNTYFDFPIE